MSIRKGSKINSYHAKIEVRLKPGHVDSEGLTAKEALSDMGYEVQKASTAKVYEINFEANSLGEAEERVEEMCKKLLANPVKDDYTVEVEEAE